MVEKLKNLSTKGFILYTQQSITDPDGLQAVEREIIQATDKIAALMTALKIQHAVDSDELGEKADELVQSMPEKLKNQGKRIVTIQTSRGAAVKVAAPYYNRKKKVERNYFIRNLHRMCYQKISDLNLPIGSGAMESAIRRVVNLRLKGASIYWLEKTAEAMLKLGKNMMEYGVLK